jgi:hypothetical protein
MIKYLSSRILVLTALYVCIIFGIFAIQFRKGNAFSLAIGSMMVSGSMDTSNSGNPRPILPLHIGVNGIDFFLDGDNQLKAYSGDNTAVLLKIAGIIEKKSSYTLIFTENVSVTFASEKRANEDIITVSAIIPSKYQKIAFPYKMTRSARLERKDSLTLINTGKKQFMFSGAALDASPGNMVRALPILRSSPVVYYQTYIPAKGLLIEDLLSVPNASEASYTRAVEQFATNALASFKDAVAAGSFSEPVVAAYIAEMGRIGMYRAAIEAIPDSYRNASGRTYQTNTFLDNLEKTYPSLVAKEREDRTAISRKLTENDPAFFEFPSLVPYLADRGSTVLLNDISRFASAIDMTAVTPRQAAGIIEAMMDFSLYAPAEENTLLLLADACERKLKTSLVRIGDDLYISDDGKSINTLETLQIAPVLIRYGALLEQKRPWKAVGQLLVHSLVSFTGGTASFPAKFVFAGGDGNAPQSGIVAKSDLMLDPAQVYPVLVTGNTWYPHSLSLSLQAGPGVWAWTSAQSVKITKPSENMIKIITQFPQGETHYMVLRSIKPFYRILIYGIDFRTDARFETYNSSGYVYNEQTETLYLKMRHKAEFEEVIIYSGKDPEAVGANGTGLGAPPPDAPVSPTAGE